MGCSLLSIIEIFYFLISGFTEFYSRKSSKGKNTEKFGQNETESYINLKIDQVSQEFKNKIDPIAMSLNDVQMNLKRLEDLLSESCDRKKLDSKEIIVEDLEN